MVRLVLVVDLVMACFLAELYLFFHVENPEVFPMFLFLAAQGQLFLVVGSCNNNLAYGNCARSTSGSQNRGVLWVFCEMHDALGSRFRLRFRMLQLKTPVFCSL